MSWWLAAIVFSLPTYLIRFKIGGIPTTFLEVNLYIFFLVYFLFFWWPNRSALLHQYRGKVGNLIWPALLIFLGAVIGVAVSPDRRAALGLFKAYFLDPFLFTFAALSLLRSFQDISRIIWAMGLSVGVIGAVAIFQWLGFVPSPEPWISETPKRVTSLFEYPNAVSLYCLPPTGIFIGLLLFGKKKSIWWRVIILLIILLGFAAIYLAVSRGALIALLLVSFVAGLFSPYKKWVFVAVLAVILLLIGSLPMRERIAALSSRQDYSTISRIEFWRASGEMIKTDWLTGVGLSGFSPAYQTLAREKDYRQDLNLIYPHNIFLNFWVTLGVFGFVGFLWALVAFFFSVKRIISHSKVAKAPAKGLLIAMAMLVLHGLVDVPYLKNDLSLQFWTILIIPYLLVLIQKRADDAASSK